MMEDIVGDYKDKTVTIEDFPFFEHALKTASVHPCKHASVMKVLLDRADAALKLRLAKLKAGKDVSKLDSGMEALVDDTRLLKLTEQAKNKGGDDAKDDWEVLEEQDDEVAIRVDQYLVVFLKFMARYASHLKISIFSANTKQRNSGYRARLHDGRLRLAISMYCFGIFGTGVFWSYRVNGQHNRRICYVGTTYETQHLFFECLFPLAAEAEVETVEQSKCNILSHLGPHKAIRPPTASPHAFD
jgi:hypothetical protein